MSPKTSLFLGASCVAAIASVGSIFELSSGQPELGAVATTIILALSVPSVVLFFLAAVRDARSSG